MVTNVTSLIETNVTSKIKISSGKVGLKFRHQDKIKVKYYIRYVDSLRVGDLGGGGKKNKYVRTLISRKVLLAMMAIVERARVYEITNLLYLTLTGAQFSLDRRHPMLPDKSTTRKLIRKQEMPRDKITLCILTILHK